MKTANLPALTQDELTGWFAGRLPNNLYTTPPAIASDRDEILVIGEVEEPEVPADASAATRATARSARIARFRSETRDARIQVARDAERLFGRKVSWGARIGDVEERFTTLGVPVMTRLGMRGRRTLDTLIEAGVARSRSEALAWCVKLVAQHQSDWIASLRTALTNVEKVRGEGPDVG